MAKNCKYIRVISTVRGSYRNFGKSHNLRNMDETSLFIERLTDMNLKKVKQIRIIPTEIKFSKPSDMAEELDNPDDPEYRW